MFPTDDRKGKIDQNGTKAHGKKKRRFHLLLNGKVNEKKPYQYHNKTA